MLRHIRATVRQRVALALALMLVAVCYAVVPAATGRASASDGTAPAAAAARHSSAHTIVIGLLSFTTRKLTVVKGTSVRARNTSGLRHSVTSNAANSNGRPLFDTVVAPHRTVTIKGIAKLAPGTYRFHCRFHPNMKGTLVVTGKSGGTHASKQHFAQPLVLPKVLTGAHIKIPMKRAMVRVLPHGPKTAMWTYGGTYPGPTIRRPAGKDTKVTFVNHLPGSAGSVTVHLHGDHHASKNDGRPTSDLIKRNHARTYNYPLKNNGKPEPAAFDFYHDHRMNVTSRNNWSGLQGMFIIDGKKSYGLPSGKYDVPLLVSDRSFGAHNKLTNPFSSSSMTMTGPDAPPNDGTVGNRILVNGRYAPYFKVATHKYRLRLLNASNFQSYDFALSDHRAFLQVGTGSSLLPKSVKRHDIMLGPAQRADVIVNFRGELHKKVVLESVPRRDRSRGGIGTPSASIMQFRVVHKVADRSRAPHRLAKPPAIHAPARVSATWTFGLANNASGSYWTVNGRRFDPNRVDLAVPLGSTRTWLLRNDTTMTHFIHIHEEEWHTISRDGHRPPPWERGLVDTWRLDPGEAVKVAAKFTDYTGPFMIHCHMLDHEDHGMMAQFAVVRRGSHALPNGYHLARGVATPAATATGASSQMGAMDMSALDTATAAVRPAAQTAAAAQSWWSRVLTRGALAFLVELIAVTLLGLALRVSRSRRARRPGRVL